METLIKIAADSIGTLRKADVYRVLDESGDKRAELSHYITTQRPELADEVAACLEELQ